MSLVNKHDYYIQRCIGTKNNDDVTPDTDAKYVLKYDIDHKAWGSTPSSTKEKNLYNYFKDLDYNVMTLDITSGLITVSGKNVTITPSSALANGIVYKVVISAGAFIDAAGNSCADDSSVQFETGPTATPVIRIDKHSGKDNDNSQPTTAGIKISTETWGGEIWYKSEKAQTNSPSNIITPSSVSNPTPTDTNETNQYTGSLSNTADYAAIFKLHAYTKKDYLTTGNTTKELAFKTILTGGSYGFRGSDSTGGVSATTEFPINWYGTPSSAQSDGDKMYSWHIIKDFQAISMSSADGWDSTINAQCYKGCYNVFYHIYNMPENWGEAGAAQYVYIFGGSDGEKWVQAGLSNSKLTFSTNYNFKKVIAVRMDPNNPNKPSWDAKWNQSADLDMSGTSVNYSNP